MGSLNIVGGVVALGFMMWMIDLGKEDEQAKSQPALVEGVYATEMAAAKYCPASLVKRAANGTHWVCADRDYTWFETAEAANKGCNGREVVVAARPEQRPEGERQRHMYHCAH